MPVAFVRTGGLGGFAPVARPRFLLGSDLDSDLVDTSEGVAEHHATVRLRRGEYVLLAEDGCSLWVDGNRMPLLSLRDGDRVALTPDAVPWKFRSRVDGSYWPPEVSLGEAWLAHPEFETTAHGPGRYGEGLPIAGRDPVRTRMVPGPHGPLILKDLGPIEGGAQATQYLRFLAALGGATHPALAPVVDGGLMPVEGTPQRWMATRFVDGICARDFVASRPLGARRVVRVLRSLAEGVAHLHHRGILHCCISLGSVIVLPTNLAVLIDYGMAYSMENAVSASGEGWGVPGFRAPESLVAGSGEFGPGVDVYGLGAVGYALLTGLPPSNAEDVYTAFEALRGSDPDACAALLPLLRAALDPAPAERPSALELSEALRAAEASLDVEDGV